MDERDVASAIAERLGWLCGHVPAAFDGYIAYAGVIAPEPEPARAVIAVHCLSPLGALVAVPAEGPVLRHWQSPDVPLDAVCAASRDWYSAHPDAANVIDAAFRLRAALEQQLPVDESTWFLSVSSDERAWTSVGIGTPDHDHWSPVYLEQQADGLRVQLLPPAEPFDHVVATVDELRGLVPSLLAAVRDSLATRERFRTRPFRCVMAARAIVDALLAVRPACGAWRCRGIDQAWPSPAPWASVFYGDETHTVASLDEAGGRVHVRAGFADGRPTRSEEVLATSLAELEREMPRLVAAIERQLSRLTFDRLAKDQHYRVLVALGPFAAGDIVRLLELTDNWRDGELSLRFGREDGVTAYFTDRDPALAELDLVLAPV
ncbi:MAG: hypothetical protein M4D80_41015 [Myxococcota bacterium]|nr:hypothetical protein [Myxococcota bacterium]